MQPHVPGTGLVLAEAQFRLQLADGCVPVQRSGTAAGGEARLQRGGEPNALCVAARRGVERDVGLLRAALRLERQRGHHDGLLRGRTRGLVAQVVAAQVGLDLQAACGQRGTCGGLQALQQVAVAAAPVELQPCLAVKLRASQQVFLHAGQAVGPGDQGGRGLELQGRLALSVGGTDLAVGLEHGTGHFGLELRARVLLLDVVLHGRGLDGGLQRFHPELRERQDGLLPFALGRERLDAQRLAAGARRRARGLEVGLEQHLPRGVRACAQCALQRGGVERTVQVGGVELLHPGYALEHLAGGLEVAGRLDMALAHIDLRLLHLPPFAGVEHVGGDGVERQALLVPRTAHGVGEAGLQLPLLPGLGGFTPDRSRVQLSAQQGARTLRPEGRDVHVLQRGLCRMQGLCLPGHHVGLHMGLHGGLHRLGTRFLLFARAIAHMVAGDGACLRGHVDARGLGRERATGLDLCGDGNRRIILCHWVGHLQVARRLRLQLHGACALQPEPGLVAAVCPAHFVHVELMRIAVVGIVAGEAVHRGFRRAFPDDPVHGEGQVDLDRQRKLFQRRGGLLRFGAGRALEAQLGDVDLAQLERAREQRLQAPADPGIAQLHPHGGALPLQRADPPARAYRTRDFARLEMLAFGQQACDPLQRVGQRVVAAGPPPECTQCRDDDEHQREQQPAQAAQQAAAGGAARRPSRRRRRGRR